MHHGPTILGILVPGSPRTTRNERPDFTFRVVCLHHQRRNRQAEHTVGRQSLSRHISVNMCQLSFVKTTQRVLDGGEKGLLGATIRRCHLWCCGLFGTCLGKQHSDSLFLVAPSKSYFKAFFPQKQQLCPTVTAELCPHYSALLNNIGFCGCWQLLFLPKQTSSLPRPCSSHNCRTDLCYRADLQR